MTTLVPYVDQLEPAYPKPPVTSQDYELWASDPLLSAYGIGKDLWADEHADEYVANLRAGW